MFDNPVNAIVSIIVDAKYIIYGAVVIALFVTGLGFVLGGSFREKAKENLPYILFGVAIAMSCVTIANSVYTSFSF